MEQGEDHESLRASALLLSCPLWFQPAAQAATVDFELTGTLDFVELAAIDPRYNFEVGQTARVFGQYDDSAISGIGLEYTHFGMGTGNHLTVEIGWHSWSEAWDVDWIGGETPAITWSSGSFQSFDFYLCCQPTGDGFRSSGTQFQGGDGFNWYLGTWNAASFHTTSTTVPLPPAIGLLGSGSLIFASLAGCRKRTPRRRPGQV